MHIQEMRYLFIILIISSCYYGPIEEPKNVSSSNHTPVIEGYIEGDFIIITVYDDQMDFDLLYVEYKRNGEIIENENMSCPPQMERESRYRFMIRHWDCELIIQPEDLAGNIGEYITIIL